jgi:hypothetical protein
MEKAFKDKGATWLISEDEKKWQLFKNILDDDEPRKSYSN